mgnify:CR=1 FL=1
MINLIPDLAKQNIRYARRNTRLIRYTWISAGMALAITAVTGLSILNMQSSKNELQKELDSQNARLNNLKSVETQGQKLYDQIKTIDTLLTKQVRFSQFLPDIAKLLPPGAVLKQLDFTSSDLTGETSTATGTQPVAAGTDKPFIISAAVNSRSTATTLLENIKADKELFTSANLIDISQNGGDSPSGLSSKYPYVVTINAYFKKPTVKQ